MVAHMKTTTMLAAALALAPCLARADMADPTRPPAGMLAPASAAASAPMDALQLQSVLLGRGRTPAAVISGQLVLLGGRVGDAQLVRVTERGAILKGPQGETRLALTPQAHKQGPSAAPAETDP